LEGIGLLRASQSGFARCSSAMKRLHIAVCLLSVSLLALQIVLMQVLSIVQWHHFASMIISVALLGFGSAGSALSLFRDRLLHHSEVAIPLLMVLSGFSMSVLLMLSQSGPARFDTYLVFVESAQQFSLVLTYLLFMAPFFLGALALGIVFVREVHRIGGVYAANLAGSGIGGIAGIMVLSLMSPPQAIQLLAVIAMLAGILITSAKRHVLLVIGVAGVCLCVAMFFSREPLVPSEYKSLSKALALPGARIVAQADGLEGRVQAVESTALRYAPGLSLRYGGDIPVRAALFCNGNWFGPVLSDSIVASGHLLDYSTEAIPYIIGHQERVLVLGSGTGLNVAQALANGAQEIDAVERNSTAVKVLTEELPGPNLFALTGVTLRTIEPRTFLMGESTKYDLIVIPVLDAFGGTSGLYAMQETFVLTRESFSEMWRRLSPSGLVSVSAWVDNPVRTPLKLLATIADMLQDGGVRNPDSHMVAIRSWGTISVAARRTALQPDEIDRIRSFCRRMEFDPLFLPGTVPDERERYNRLPGSPFLAAADSVVHGSENFRRAYAFDISPATDNRPFFFRFLKLEDILSLREQFTGAQLPFVELGTFMVVMTLIQIVGLAIALILLPLLGIRWRRGGAGWTLTYFAFLGLGYLFVEIVFIRYMTQYLGHPVMAAALVISGLLLCSGIGSYISQPIQISSRGMPAIIGGIALLMVVNVIGLDRLVTSTTSMATGLKVLLAFLWMVPPAVLMGVPFPVGLRSLATRNESLIPWAWGINGCTSVIGAVLAAALAPVLGFTALLWCAGGAYGIACVAAASVRADR
jgi:hypothetical protein